ncbi:VWA domain-containing protein [Frankia sp. CNm7]|uniref:VWA domain-containing protein n=1 Tax=Frankia nepalensis TaxID=1836974 RepID=A0A937UR71_9ACTN|nr:VWA domain-containing protein [Frankia nepalensis]MBL7495108.1 VWA domain-containing protein [Frankia nepalensis]MBL7515391.1 VWA domain-containing protein [Frankia nepalensis]MBL7518845.1 VWA domain-containing protein [Frankia nepalensis]MBL7632564.1 VWA domain-containing protein [Frankia nepalensis]
MSLTWPWALLTLAALPLLWAVVWWGRRRRRRAAVRVTSVALVRVALPGRTRWHRRVPVALLVLGLATLGLGAARPQARVPVAANSTTILLALDVSRSMCSTDVTPNRLTAAAEAAADFIRAQPGGSRIGLVTFAGVAGLLVPPTDDTDELLGALESLTTSRGTAIGQGILTSIDAIAEVDPSVAPIGVPLDEGDAQGDYAANVIVVLTDGANTQGVEPQTAAEQAAARRLRVFTIGFGTTTPSPPVCASSQIGEDAFGPGGGFGGGPGGGGGRFGDRSPLTIDEGALREVADATGGMYYRAQNAGELQEALAALPRNITVTYQHKDIAALFAGIGGLLVAAAVALSLWWNRVRRPPAARPTAATLR